MTTHRDPFDILRANNPIDARSVDSHTPHANALFAAITATPRVHRRTFKLYLRIAIAIVAMLAALAAAWVLTSREVTLLGIICYESVGLDRNRSGVGSSGSLDSEQCAPQFEDGTLQVPGQPVGFVPPFTTFVTDLGALAVFPTDNPETCADLGLAELAANQPTEELTAVAAVQQDITHWIHSSNCPPLDEAEAVFRRALDDHGLGHWTVVRRPDVEGRPCTSVAYQIDRETLVIVPIHPSP